MAVTPGFVVTQASTLLLIVLGVFALVAKPRTRASRGFGWMGIGLAVGVFVANFVQAMPGPLTLAWAPIGTVGYCVALWGLWAVLTPEGRMRPDERTPILLLCALLATAPLLALFLGLRDPAFAALLASPLVFWTVGMLLSLQVTAYGTAPVLAAILLAIRHARTAREAHAERLQWALMAVGLAVVPAVIGGTLLLGVVLVERGLGLYGGLLAVLATLAWLAAGERGHDPRETRRVAWALAGAFLVGMLVRAIAPPEMSSDDTGIFGVARLFAFALFGYAILRHQMLGLDVKVRFAISKSTIAATFIAAFFIASEVAQQFFGATFNSAYVGIAAAGALVFAIAPLQRAAERLAEKAVPIGAAVGPGRTGAGSRTEEAYRDVLRRYLRDGALTRDEERALAVLAGEMRLDAGRAFELREEIERETPARREAA